jgi:alanyl-tRNA synthetase
MDPVTIAAGFALAKKSIELCKSALETAEDVQGIAGHLDNLFEQKDKAEQHVKDAKNKPQSAMQKAIANKTDGDNSDTSLSAITVEVLEQKKIDRAILNLSRKINNKFGKGS